jgi:hypothetical protein
LLRHHRINHRTNLNLPTDVVTAINHHHCIGPTLDAAIDATHYHWDHLGTSTDDLVASTGTSIAAAFAG